MARGKVAVFGVPSAAGARAPGTSRAPFALRQAGLLEALRAAGPRVVNLSDLSLFPYLEDPEHPSCRNLAGAACAARAAADEMGRALQEGFTIVLGGDCSLLPGTAGGVRTRLGRDLGVVLLDADADLNTPQTTPSGRLNGMALALALGRGPGELAAAGGALPALRAEHAALLGFRALDPAEREAIGDLALVLPALAVKALGPRASAALALDAIENGDGPLLVHFDVDVIDPEQMPAKRPLLPGPGLSLAEAGGLLTALMASPRVAALEICEYDPDLDPEGRHARTLVELVAGAVARRFRGRGLGRAETAS
jgi:arginase